MKKIILLLLVFIISAGVTFGQQRTPPELQYVSPSGKISLSKDTPFFQAIQMLRTISARTDTIIIIDDETRTGPINVEIIDKDWREALDLILRVNNLEMEENPTYIRIVEPAAAAALAAGEAAAPEITFNSSMREINISAIFFEGDKSKLKETGINWSTLIQRDNNLISAEQTIAGQISANFTDLAEYEGVDQTVDATINFLESKSIGEVLASPNIQVLEGQEGKIQVGQDFSIKQMDFAGNVIDVFYSSGIILTVTPMVITEDSIQFIYLKVNAERSQITPSQVTTIINKTVSNTSLFLLDGEKAAVAGLYTTQETTIRNGLPILKDLPGWFLGIKYIAGYNKVEQTEKELIIILKADLVPTVQNRDMLRMDNNEFLEKKIEELRKRIQKRKKKDG
ncbi:MAG: type II and III secretion system protein [bacterium]|nr:type II and III secretion system protein [bacterium]